MRRTGMRAFVAALAVLVVAGCGSDTGSRARPGPGVAGSRGCTPQVVAERGKVVAAADLDGRGGREKVRLLGPADGRCGDSLVAVVDGRVAGVGVRRLRLVSKGAQVVRLRGSEAADLVLLWSAPHPRGGAQPHLFSLGRANRLVEVTADGGPVLPFVATDGGGSPMTATCTPSGGIAVFTAVAHEPPGIVLAWDVTRTTYDIRGGRAVATGSGMVEQAAADPTLRRRRPDLFAGELFADCR
jgi:hypothetical protein